MKSWRTHTVFDVGVLHHKRTLATGEKAQVPLDSEFPAAQLFWACLHQKETQNIPGNNKHLKASWLTRVERTSAVRYIIILLLIKVISQTLINHL